MQRNTPGRRPKSAPVCKDGARRARRGPVAQSSRRLGSASRGLLGRVIPAQRRRFYCGARRSWRASPCPPKGQTWNKVRRIGTHGPRQNAGDRVAAGCRRSPGGFGILRGGYGGEGWLVCKLDRLAKALAICMNARIGSVNRAWPSRRCRESADRACGSRRTANERSDHLLAPSTSRVPSRDSRL